MVLGPSRSFQQRATSSKPNHVADGPAQQPSKKGNDKHGDQIQHALRCEDTCCSQRRVARVRYSDCRYCREGKECNVCSYQRFSLDLPKFRHRQPVSQPTVTAGIMTLGRGCCILGVKTCQRCIEHLVFGLFDCGVGEFDCLSRMGFGSLGPFLRPVRLQIRLVLV
jgi:hypothetical protein